MNLPAKIARNCAILIVGHFVLFGFGNFVAHIDDTKVNDQVSEQAAFWTSVAGGGSNSPSVENRLARDLATRLGPVELDATELPDEITDFRGSSNAYGGISEEIGFNPFTNQGCDECGPLNDTTLNGLLLIKQGNISQLVDDVEEDRRSTDWTMTWDEDDALLPWLIGYVTAVALGTAAIEYVPQIPQIRRRRKIHALVVKHFPAQAELIEQTDKYLEDDDDPEIRNTRDKLYFDLSRQAVLIDSGDPALWDEEKIKRDLADATEVIELRAKVRDTL